MRLRVPVQYVVCDGVSGIRNPVCCMFVTSMHVLPNATIHRACQRMLVGHMQLGTGMEAARALDAAVVRTQRSGTGMLKLGIMRIRMASGCGLWTPLPGESCDTHVTSVDGIQQPHTWHTRMPWRWHMGRFLVCHACMPCHVPCS